MSTLIAGVSTVAKPPTRARAVTIMAGLGALTGLISSLPSPFPDLRLENPEFFINERSVPLHAGIAFGLGLTAMLWLWVNRDFGKCLLAFAFAIIAWLIAANSANDVISAVVSSDLFGREPGAKASREVLGWVLGGFVGGGIGAGLIVFGTGIAAKSVRRAEAWIPVVVTGALVGLMLYPAMRFDTMAILFVPWQAAIAAAIAAALTRRAA